MGRVRPTFEHARPASPAVTVFVVGGTGESHLGDRRTEVTGLLSGVADVLDERFACRWVGYPASYGPAPEPGGMSFADSVAIGAARLASLLEVSAGTVALVGYSQGAVVIRTALAALADRGDGVLGRILGIGFVADPHQPPGAVPGCDGWGVAGPGEPLPPGIPVIWVGAPDDMICNARPDSLVRDIADLTRPMAAGTAGRWLRSAWGTLRRNDLQNADRTAVRPSQWRRDVGLVGDPLLPPRRAAVRRTELGQRSGRTPHLVWARAVPPGLGDRSGDDRMPGGRPLVTGPGDLHRRGHLGRRLPPTARGGVIG